MTEQAIFVQHLSEYPFRPSQSHARTCKHFPRILILKRG